MKPGRAVVRVLRGITDEVRLWVAMPFALMAQSAVEAQDWDRARRMERRFWRLVGDEGPLPDRSSPRRTARKTPWGRRP